MMGALTSVSVLLRRASVVPRRAILPLGQVCVARERDFYPKESACSRARACVVWWCSSFELIWPTLGSLSDGPRGDGDELRGYEEYVCVDLRRIRASLKFFVVVVLYFAPSCTQRVRRCIWNARARVLDAGICNALWASTVECARQIDTLGQR